MFRYGNWAQSISRPSGAHRIAAFAAFADHPAQKAPATATVAAPTGSTCSPTASSTTRGDGTYGVRGFENRQKLALELMQIGVGAKPSSSPSRPPGSTHCAKTTLRHSANASSPSPSCKVLALGKPQRPATAFPSANALRRGLARRRASPERGWSG